MSKFQSCKALDRRIALVPDNHRRCWASSPEEQKPLFQGRSSVGILDALSIGRVQPRTQGWGRKEALDDRPFWRGRASPGALLSLLTKSAKKEGHYYINLVRLYLIFQKVSAACNSDVMNAPVYSRVLCKACVGGP